MGAAISIEEYLRTSFEDGDREYLDGAVVERGLSDDAHSRAQWRLSGLFWDLSQKLPFRGCTGLRVRVRPTRVRISDVCIFAGGDPAERVPAQPPLVAIEILSPDDRHSELMRKFEEYSAFGVRYIWLVDPESRNSRPTPMAR